MPKTGLPRALSPTPAALCASARLVCNLAAFTHAFVIHGGGGVACPAAQSYFAVQPAASAQILDNFLRHHRDCKKPQVTVCCSIAALRAWAMAVNVLCGVGEVLSGSRQTPEQCCERQTAPVRHGVNHRR